MVWRFIIAAMSMLFVLFFRGSNWRINLRGALSILASAVFLVLYNHLYFTGTHLGAAGAGGVLVTTLNPVLTFILISIIRQSYLVAELLPESCSAFLVGRSWLICGRRAGLLSSAAGINNLSCVPQLGRFSLWFLPVSINTWAPWPIVSGCIW